MDDPNQRNTSAVYDIAVRKAIDDAALKGKTLSEAELDAIGKLADAKNVYGFDAVQNRDGTWQQQGIGAWPHHVTGNHMASVLRYEGRAAYEKLLRRLWKEAPAKAKALNLPEPARVGA